MNNMSKSFNSWKEEARVKHVVDLVETIRDILKEQQAQRKLNATTWNEKLVLYIEEYIKEMPK